MIKNNYSSKKRNAYHDDEDDGSDSLFSLEECRRLHRVMRSATKNIAPYIATDTFIDVSYILPTNTYNIYIKPYLLFLYIDQLSNMIWKYWFQEYNQIDHSIL